MTSSLEMNITCGDDTCNPSERWSSLQLCISGSENHVFGNCNGGVKENRRNQKLLGSDIRWWFEQGSIQGTTEIEGCCRQPIN